MVNVWRRLRQAVLTPSVRQTHLDVRGFRAKDATAQDLLEEIGVSFLIGFRHAVGARDAAETGRLLDGVRREFRGFAYEGAGMGLALLDGMSPGGPRRIEAFLAGPAAEHTYMVHVGVGWALARLPRARWRAALPPDRLLRWLALDGYGFHQAYFHTAKYVHAQQRGPDPRLPGDPGGYSQRVVDQGIGRALWFVEGTDVARVAGRIDTFDPQRRGDLFSGAGLAATYAAGASTKELLLLRERAGAHRADLAQGSAFAAKARLRAGLAGPGTAAATAVLCGTTPEAAAAVTDKALADLAAAPDIPAFEVWRQRIAGELLPVGGS
ncbi:DUF1702 family protein [Micromonospora sp. NPDC003776]